MATKLNASERKQLLTIARDTISTYISSGKLPTATVKSENLQATRGCFVSIKKGDKLRGCIGTFIADKPLYLLIQEMAVSAATKDPRFYPMKESDLTDFTLEISVLSPLRKITNNDEIKVGEHGIYLEKNFSRGVLLPQVAVEQGWDRETFLGQTCLKAGLQTDAWKEGADIYIFSAEVFS